MYFNKESQYKENNCNINKSQEYEIKSNTLDLLYKEQLTELRDLILKNAEANDIEICQKWLKVFSNTSNGEKIARNCLCRLMFEQIKEYGCLQKPFINLQNCYRNLESVLRGLEIESNDSTNSSESNVTFQSHNCLLKKGEQIFSERPEQNTNSVVEECKNIALTTETMELFQELKALRLQLTEKQIENVKLREIAEKCRLERDELENNLENVKRSMLECLRQQIQEIRQHGLKWGQLQFFRYIFSQFASDKEFMKTVSKCDSDFQYILHSSFHSEFNRQKNLIARHICRKFIKTKSRLRDKYERQLVIQNQTYKLQLELTKLKSFSIMRQLFVDARNNSTELNIWEILKTFEEIYQKLLNTD